MSKVQRLTIVIAAAIVMSALGRTALAQEQEPDTDDQGSVAEDQEPVVEEQEPIAEEQDPVSEEPSVVLIIDANSIASGRLPGFSDEDVNEPIADVGLRYILPYFARSSGQVIQLATGQGQVGGWFKLTAVPDTWASDDGGGDGLSNFVRAGPGLGSPDSLDSRVALLTDAGLAALGPDDIAALSGKTVCSVVYQGTLTAAESSANLAGPTLGLAAFRINTVAASSQTSPDVEIEILNAVEICQRLTLP